MLIHILVFLRSYASAQEYYTDAYFYKIKFTLQAYVHVCMPYKHTTYVDVYVYIYEHLTPQIKKFNDSDYVSD